MNQRIEAHVNALFTNRPNASQVSDIKEELLSNLNDKFDDLILSGKSEDEAFALVISGIGDIDNLLKDLGESPDYQPLEIEKNQQKRGVFISIGIALYVLSIVPIILFEQMGNSALGVVSMFVVCAAATGFVVFGNSIGKTKYSKTDNSFVEEYKEKVAVDSDRKKLRNAITSSMWPLLVVVYLAFSFITNWWYVSWVIFIIGACVQQIIVYKFSNSEKCKNVWHGILWTATTALYFIISFAVNAWAWSWMIFIMAVAAEQIIRLLIIWKRAG